MLTWIEFAVATICAALLIFIVLDAWEVFKKPTEVLQEVKIEKDEEDPRRRKKDP
jgi:hypothetical protein